MNKLIITVTCDSTMSYPRNPFNPKSSDLAKEYVRSVNAGAAVCHLHGPYTVDSKIREDNTKLSDLDIDGWLRLRNDIEDRCQPVIQYGIANGRYPQRVELMKQQPDMMSICYNAHDECFQPDPDFPAVELYGIHSREELEAYGRETRRYGVKPEVESFHYGAIWNARRMMQRGLLDAPVWTTFFLGWPGGCWTPPTIEALQYMHHHKPPEFNYSVSVMDPPTHWTVLTESLLLGGHVRVGMEDSPYLDHGQTLARSNAELVEKIVRIAREVGREIASPTEARAIIGLPAVRAQGGNA